MRTRKHWMIMALACLLITGCANPANRGETTAPGNMPPEIEEEKQGEASASSDEGSERKVTVEELASIPMTEQGTWIEAKDGTKWFKNTGTFYNTFDTVIQLISYTKTEEDFASYFALTKQEYERLHQLFDNYKEYEGVVNFTTLNHEAAKKPVKVDKELYDLIAFCIENYEKTLGKVNLAMGAPLALWHDAREAASEEEGEDHEHGALPEPQGVLPDATKLKEAGQHTNIEDIVLDPTKQTVYYKDPELKLDPGAVAKGYATEIVAQKLREAGFEHGIISAGGNVKTIGTPVDGRDSWTVGISHPRPDKGQLIATVRIDGTTSMVTSGDYQRYFYVGEKRYHHIIDPKTLMPVDRYTSVSIKTEDSGLADLLSTTFFLCNEKEAKQVLENYKDEGVEVVWVDSQLHVTSTEGIKRQLKIEK